MDYLEFLITFLGADYLAEKEERKRRLKEADLKLNKADRKLRETEWKLELAERKIGDENKSRKNKIPPRKVKKSLLD